MGAPEEKFNWAQLADFVQSACFDNCSMLGYLRGAVNQQTTPK
jgi:hypothetical protein